MKRSISFKCVLSALGEPVSGVQEDFGWPGSPLLRTRSCPAKLNEDPSSPLFRGNWKRSSVPSTPVRRVPFKKTFRKCIEQVIASTPRTMLTSAKKSIFISRRAFCSSRQLTSLLLEFQEDEEALIDAIADGKRHVFELALRIEVSKALHIPLSSVIFDSCTAPCYGLTQVELLVDINTDDLCEERVNSCIDGFRGFGTSCRVELRPMSQRRVAGNLASVAIFLTVFFVTCIQLSSAFVPTFLHPSVLSIPGAKHILSRDPSGLRTLRPVKNTPVMLAPVPLSVDPALVALLLQASARRAWADLERLGVGPPRGGSSRVVYVRGEVRPAAEVLRWRHPARQLRRVASTLGKNPINGTATLVRSAAISALSCRAMEEEHPVEAAVMEEIESQAVEKLVDSLDPALVASSSIPQSLPLKHVFSEVLSQLPTATSSDATLAASGLPGCKLAHLVHLVDFASAVPTVALVAAVALALAASLNNQGCSGGGDGGSRLL